MIENKKHWENFYKDFKELRPSDFVKTLEFSQKDIVADIGCGNGRDSYYIGKTAGVVNGFDLNNKPKDTGNVKFYQKDINDVDLRKYNVVYSRFFFHSIPKETVSNIIDQCRGFLFIECRSDKGVVPSNDHYRRLINRKELMEELEQKGFRLHVFNEGYGLAEYKDEDPCVLRLIAEKIK